MEVISIFTIPDKRLFASSYFNILRSYEDYCELLSVNTEHCWIIRKVFYNQGMKVMLYHKHHISDVHYHLHRSYCRNVKQAIDTIYGHDRYVLKRRMILDSCYSKSFKVPYHSAK